MTTEKNFWIFSFIYFHVSFLRTFSKIIWTNIQYDHVNFDSFAQFAVFIQNLGYFLFRYSWIEHHLLYRTIYFLFCLLYSLSKSLMHFEKHPKKLCLISNFQGISQVFFLDDYFLLGHSSFLFLYRIIDRTLKKMASYETF